MDLLSSLGLENDLPEQSTRLRSHPGVIEALEKAATASDGAEDIRLGFTHCCHCGVHLAKDSKFSDGSDGIGCTGCGRIRYCSNTCREKDSDPALIVDDDDEEEEMAAGHSAVICALLRTCEEDDDAEEEFLGSDDGLNGRRVEQAARYRVQTEMESYPATLFNLLAEAPPSYQEAMMRRVSGLLQLKGGKRERENQKAVEFVVHVVGASEESEMWQSGETNNGANVAAVWEAYAEASTNLLSSIKTQCDNTASVNAIRLVFVGPECPRVDSNITVPIPDSESKLLVETHRCNYGGCGDAKGKTKGKNFPPPDAVVFFNPGFSCPDYDWTLALSTASSNDGVPFLVTTNTEMEGLADLKCMYDGGHIGSMLADEILQAIYGEEWEDMRIEDSYMDDATFFFSENPYAGLRVRQSGTMANDLYVKSRWILGGVFKSGGTEEKMDHEKHLESVKSNEKKEEEEQMQGRKKHKGGSGNTKRKNPALI